jgi:signal transduction histidine kinase
MKTQEEKIYHPPQQEAGSLLRQAYEARINNLPLSIELTRQVLDHSLQTGDGEMEARAKSQLGLLYMIQGEFGQSLAVSGEALLYFERTNNIKGIADAKYNIAGVHYKTDNYHQGLHYLLDCLRIYRVLNDAHNESRVLKSMGTVYEYFGDLDNAIDSYLKCIDAAAVAGDRNLESNAYNPLSGIYLEQGNAELALATIEKSIDIKKQTQDVRGLGYALYGRGKIHLKLRRYNQALDDLTESLNIHEAMGEAMGKAMTYTKLGLVYLETGQYQRAEQTLLAALDMSERHDIRFIRFKACYNLHLVMRAKGNLPEALEYLERYLSIRDTVINKHTHNIIKSYEAIYKVEVLEREARAQRDRTAIIERKNAELDSFFYRVSHDLKGPIASLMGLHNMIQLEVQDANTRRFFDMYQTQIHRINNIVMDLIHLTRMNHTEAHKTKIDFTALVDECIGTYHYLENFNKIRFIAEIDTDLEFYSEWAIFNTILQNLIENAIKYARPTKNPFVRILIRASGENILLMVEDNGMGIAPEHQEKVFNMFFRANDLTQGTGLGLYILKRAVERLDGQVNFVSTINVGSTFTVLLPGRKVAR